MKKNVLLILLSLITILYFRNNAFPKEKKSILKGDVLITKIVENKRIRGAKAVTIMETTPKLLWEVLTDHDHIEEFMPNINESKLIKREGKRVWVLKSLAASIFKVKVVLEITEDTNKYVLSWKQSKGPFKFHIGKWILEPYGKNRTKITYSIEMAHPLLPKWLGYRLMNKDIPKMFRSVYKRVKHIKAKKIAAMKKKNIN